MFNCQNCGKRFDANKRYGKKGIFLVAICSDKCKKEFKKHEEWFDREYNKSNVTERDRVACNTFRKKSLLSLLNEKKS